MIDEAVAIGKKTMLLFREKLMIAIILTTAAQIIEQFSQSFGADSLLLLLLFSLIFLDMALQGMVMIKERLYSVSAIAQLLLKLPLFCLYMFLVGCVAISLEHSIQFALPLLNLFIAYLAASETAAIVADLKDLNVKVPSLLLLITTDFKQKIEGRLKKVARGDDDDKEEGHDR